MAGPLLQVALDVLSLEEALQVGKKALEGGADWIEAGTPLIKKEGINAVRLLKEALRCVTVADMKVIDAGKLEARMAFEAGADMITVLSAAKDRTIKEAVSEAREWGGKVAVDTIGLDEPPDALKRVKQLEVDLVYIHSGIDEQMEGKTPFESLARINAKIEGIRIGVAGGINLMNITALKGKSVDVVVVGSAITRSPNPALVTSQIKSVMRRL